jgi:2,4-dienoyl-CoA reductase-like NADH-dependent reductase (Old Yellow Enzyme family)
MLNETLALPCGVTLKNRIAKSAMSENMGSRDYRPTKELSRLYRRWSQGGAGLIITGNVMIDKSALGEPRNVAIEVGHECYEELMDWAKAGTENQTQFWMQINHPGKQSPKFLSSKPVAPSAIGYEPPMNKMFVAPRALSHEEILTIIKRYADTAYIAKKAGFTGVQIHGAHGYLVSQFLSSRHNKRNDTWGGNIDRRMRFVVDIYQAIRKQVGDNFPVAIKLNSADFQKGGFSEEESMKVVKTLADLGMDLIEISGGTYEAPAMMEGRRKKLRKSTKKREAYFLDYCEKIKDLVDTPILLTGGFRTADGMNEALKTGACQLVGMARAIAIDPEFPLKLLSGNKVESPVKPLTTGYKFLDQVVPLEITWYTQQLQRMGRGKDPKPNASTKFSVLKTLYDYGFQGLTRVRA